MAQGQDRKISNNAVVRCFVLTFLLVALAQPVFARTYMKCATRKVILVSTPNRDTSLAKQEDLDFWVDDEAKTLAFLDNTPLTVTRFERFWISATRDGIFYESDRGDNTISYASSTIKDGVLTTIVGSGQCEAPHSWWSDREAYGLTYAFCQASGSPLIASIAADVGTSPAMVRKILRKQGYLGARPRIDGPATVAQSFEIAPKPTVRPTCARSVSGES